MYKLINKHQDKIYSYSVQVFSNGKYVGWGIPHDTEEEAINHLKKYLFDIKNLDSDYYKKQYKEISIHPIKVIKKECMRNWEMYEKLESV